MKQAPVPDAELRRAKDHLKGSLMLSLENTASRMSHLARQEIYFERHFGLDETLAGVERVTPADVTRVATDLFSNGSLAATVVGPSPREMTRAQLDPGMRPDRGRPHVSDDSALYASGDGRDLERSAPLRNVARGGARRRRRDGGGRAGARARPRPRCARRRAFDIARIEEIESGHAARRDRLHDRRRREGRARRRAGCISASPRRTSSTPPRPSRCARPAASSSRNLGALMEAVRERADEHRRTPMIGRTHGVHAEPMTFGLKLALWYAELQRDLDRVLRARDVVSVGKISGAVGTFAHLDPAIEARVCERLGLEAAPVSSQVIQRDRHAELMSALAITARLAREVRARDPRAAEDRDRRSRGAVRQGAEGLVGDAAQAQPDRVRADRRAGAAAARQRDGGVREHRALARARHLALLGRARDPARQLHRPRSHAPALHADRPRDGGLSRAHAARTWAARAASCFRARCCSSWPSAASRASRPTSGCSATPCARSTSSRISRRCFLADPDVMQVLTPAEVEKAFDLDDQLRNVDADHRPGASRRRRCIRLKAETRTCSFRL